VRTKGTEASAFSPTGGRSFHDVMKFAPLIVRGIETVKKQPACTPRKFRTERLL